MHHFQKKGVIVAGCDYDAGYVNYGRKFNMNLVHGGIETLIPYGQADLIILCHVLEHFLDLVTELKKINSLLKPGSLVYLSLPGIFAIRDTYGDFAHFIQNAHVWHFCLATLNYTMSLSEFKFLSGNESIDAFYRLIPGYRPLPPQASNCQSVLKSISRTERLHYLPNLKWWIGKSIPHFKSTLSNSCNDRNKTNKI